MCLDYLGGSCGRADTSSSFHLLSENWRAKARQDFGNKKEAASSLFPYCVLIFLVLPVVKFHPFANDLGVNGIWLCRFPISKRKPFFFRDHKKKNSIQWRINKIEKKQFFFNVWSHGILKACLWNWFMLMQGWNHHDAALKVHRSLLARVPFHINWMSPPVLFMPPETATFGFIQRRRVLDFLASCVCWFGSSCDVTAWRPRKQTTWTRRRSLPPARERNGCGGGLTSS